MQESDEGGQRANGGVWQACWLHKKHYLSDIEKLPQCNCKQKGVNRRRNDSPNRGWISSLATHAHTHTCTQTEQDYAMEFYTNDTEQWAIFTSRDYATRNTPKVYAEGYR